MGESSQPDSLALRAALEELEAETGRSLTLTDEYASELLYQVIALEEILAARWPRSVLVRARWRRDVRASVRGIVHPGSFTKRRLETIGTGWLARPGAQR
jgi:hypothetical protein